MGRGVWRPRNSWKWGWRETHTRMLISTPAAGGSLPHAVYFYLRCGFAPPRSLREFCRLPAPRLPVSTCAARPVKRGCRAQLGHAGAPPPRGFTESRAKPLPRGAPLAPRLVPRGARSEPPERGGEVLLRAPQLRSGGSREWPLSGHFGAHFPTLLSPGLNYSSAQPAHTPLPRLPGPAP